MNSEELLDQLDHKSRNFHVFLRELAPDDIPETFPFNAEQIHTMLKLAATCYGEYCHEIMTDPSVDIGDIVNDLVQSPVDEIHEAAKRIQTALKTVTAIQKDKVRRYIKFLLETSARLSSLGDALSAQSTGVASWFGF